MSLRTYYLGVGVGFGLMVAGILTGITWFFDLQSDKNPVTLAASGLVVVVVALAKGWKR